MKYHIFLGYIAVVAAYPGVIHDVPQVEEKYDHQALLGESGHQHHIEHEHAKSHQSIKFEHFHPVPVYIKKEHSHLLKHPLEKGKSEQNLKQIHPETQQHHGGGLVLEDHRYDSGLQHGGYEHGGFENAGLDHADYSHGDFNHQGGFESGEGLKAYADLQHAEPHYLNEHQALSNEGSEGYKYEGY